MAKINLILNIIAIASIVILVYMFTGNNNKIAYVNNNKLIVNYKGMKKASEVYQNKTKSWEANIDTLGNELDEIINKFIRDSINMSANEKLLSRQLIETKRKQFIQYRDAIQQKAQQEDQKMTQDIISKMNAFVKEYGKENNYTIIMGATTMGNIVYAEEAIDLTDEILEKINKEYDGN